MLVPYIFEETTTQKSTKRRSRLPKPELTKPTHHTRESDAAFLSSRLSMSLMDEYIPTSDKHTSSDKRKSRRKSRRQKSEKKRESDLFGIVPDAGDPPFSAREVTDSSSTIVTSGGRDSGSDSTIENQTSSPIGRSSRRSQSDITTPRRSQTDSKTPRRSQTERSSRSRRNEKSSRRSQTNQNSSRRSKTERGSLSYRVHFARSTRHSSDQIIFPKQSRHSLKSVSIRGSEIHE